MAKTTAHMGSHMIRLPCTPGGHESSESAAWFLGSSAGGQFSARRDLLPALAALPLRIAESAGPVFTGCNHLRHCRLAHIAVGCVMSEQQDIAELKALKQQFLELAERDPDCDVGALFDEATRIRFGRMIAAAASRSGHGSNSQRSVFIS
jgi:hypothetical protein